MSSAFFVPKLRHYRCACCHPVAVAAATDAYAIRREEERVLRESVGWCWGLREPRERGNARLPKNEVVSDGADVGSGNETTAFV